MSRRLALGIPLALLATACATLPPGPSVMVLPGTLKTFEDFQTDDAVCRQWAALQTGTTRKRAAGESAASGATIGTVLGAALGAAFGAAAGNPGIGAAVGAGTGLLGGTVGGADTAEGAARSRWPGDRCRRTPRSRPGRRMYRRHPRPDGSASERDGISRCIWSARSGPRSSAGSCPGRLGRTAPGLHRCGGIDECGAHTVQNPDWYAALTLRAAALVG